MYGAYAYMVMWSWTVRSMNLAANTSAIAIDINSKKNLQVYVQANIIEVSAVHIHLYSVQIIIR